MRCALQKRPPTQRQLASLGAQVDVVEMLDGVRAGADRDMVKVWQKYNEKRLGRLMVKTRLAGQADLAAVSAKVRARLSA